MTTRPDPLTPPDSDLGDFAFMPLMVARLRKSKAWVKAKRNPALGFYMMNLWMAAWHEVPAGSLEDDDDVLMDAAMCEPAKWSRVREDALRGWVLCSDGRLYHPVVCEQVMDAWTSKLERRDRNEHENNRKRLEREERSKLFAELKAAGIHKPWNTSLADLRATVQVLTTLQPADGPTPDRNLSAGQVEDSPGTVRDLSRLRQGQGQGQGYIKEKETAAAPSPGSTAQDSAGAPPPSPSQSRVPSRPTQIVVLLRAWEKARGAMCTVTSSNPHVTAWAEHGVTDEQLREAYDLAVQDREKNLDPSGINAGFLDVFVSKVLNPAPGESRVKAVPPTDPLAWALKWSGVEAKAKELGIEQQPGESSPAFKARVHAAAGVTDEDRRRVLADFGERI